jgi:hypothetical protein
MLQMAPIGRRSAPSGVVTQLVVDSELPVDTELVVDSELVELRDGSVVSVRALHDGDEAALGVFLTHLSAEARRTRYFSGAVDMSAVADVLPDNEAMLDVFRDGFAGRVAFQLGIKSVEFPTSSWRSTGARLAGNAGPAEAPRLQSSPPIPRRTLRGEWVGLSAASLNASELPRPRRVCPP